MNSAHDGRFGAIRGRQSRLNTMNIAAFDLGSNSFHLLVAQVDTDGKLVKVGGHREVLRLGTGVQEHGRLTPESFDRALDAVGRMVSVARAYRAERYVAAGTSALRDAANGHEFCAAVSARYGLPVDLLSGREEGEIVFRGACRGLNAASGRKAVIDIGGGSVEVAVGDGERIEHVESLPLGFLRLAKALGGPVETMAPRVAARVFTETTDVAKRLWALRPEAWVFSGGTARAVGKLMLMGSRGVSAVTLGRVAEELAAAKPERLIELGVDVARSETIGIGVAVMSALVQRIGVPSLHISPGGLREGLIARELASGYVPERARISA
jgi:exopolyphosphatase/guanosine-5'-triphosphate,3'-diphosphate pyrophosphatase